MLLVVYRVHYAHDPDNIVVCNSKENANLVRSDVMAHHPEIEEGDILITKVNILLWLIHNIIESFKPKISPKVG